MPPLVRFAPSPTGYLHVGNVRTALVNYLFARAGGGQFLLRFDDTDVERSKVEYAAAIEEDLRWLGLEWASVSRQSARFAAYAAGRERLLQSGRLYPCFETQEELDIRRKLQAGRGLPPVYDRASLRLSEAEKAACIQSGRRPHYRFRLDDAPIEWHDLVRGPVRFQAGHMSDPVLVREDGVPLYTFASVVDDIDMNITHVIRGEDHVSNTAVQTQIFTALGATPPEFGHLALLRTKDGELSKRVGGNDIRGLREAGIEPMAVCSLLATIGTSDPVAPFPTMEALAARFDFAKFGRAPANYDTAELERLNARLLGSLTFAQVQPRLATIGLAQVDEAFWLSVRGNLTTLPDIIQWWDIVHNPDFTAPTPAEPDYLREAARLLPPAPWDATVWDRWITAIKAATSRKGKELFLPLRLAITGREHGPELKHLLPILGFDATYARLHP